MMRKLFFILLICFAVNAKGQQPQIGILFVGQEGWKYKRAITLDQPASDLTDFPILFSGTYSYLATTANGGEVLNASGYDIAFFSDAGLTTMLSFEREQYVATTGEVTYWIKIPTLTSASATVIYIAYGNSTITGSLENVSNTWRSSYVGVYHLPNGTTLNTDDVTANNYDAIKHGSPTAASGKIYGGMGGSYAYVPDNSAMTISSGGTVEAWFYKTNTTNATMLNKKGAGRGEFIGGMLNSNNIYFWVADSVTNGYRGRIAPSSSYSINSWHHVTFVYDGGTLSSSVKIYVDGVQSDNADFSSGTFTTIRNTSDLFFIKNSNTALGSAMAGTLDEVRISNVAYSADWIATQFSNQNDPANFYSIGSQINN